MVPYSHFTLSHWFLGWTKHLDNDTWTEKNKTQRKTQKEDSVSVTDNKKRFR